MRFRRRIRLFPGMYINLSKTGISTTVGIPGASINLGRQGAFLNTGIPGTGLYDRQRIGAEKKKQPGNRGQAERGGALPQHNIEHYTPLATTDVTQLTTPGLQPLKDTLIACFEERAELRKAIEQARSKLSFAEIFLFLSYVFIIGFFTKYFRIRRRERQEDLADLIDQLEACQVDVDLEVDTELDAHYQTLITHYTALIGIDRIWDITALAHINPAMERTAASGSIIRKPVKFAFQALPLMRSRFEALHFQNANGGDIYIYPAFIAVVESAEQFALIDLEDLEIAFHGQRFQEEEVVPADAEVLDYTWARTNKDGSQDRRFKHNYQIPLCRYGELKLTSSKGLHEVYCFSNFEKANLFAQSLIAYRSLVAGDSYAL
jgi:hypothetical protein